MARTDVYTLKHKDLLDVQDAMVRKIVETLKDFDNLYYEICNEPYFGGVTLEWQYRIAQTIVEAEKQLGPLVFPLLLRQIGPKEPGKKPVKLM